VIFFFFGGGGGLEGCFIWQAHAEADRAKLLFLKVKLYLNMAAKEVKPSAVELLARLSGKKKLEPTVQDAIEEIEVTIPFC
jgi:hypothetical protein